MKKEKRTDSGERRSVLFVDDEPHIIESLRRMLRNEPYQTLFAVSGREALDILEKENIHVVVSDLRMPEIDGLSLLKQVQKDHPHTIRIVLSMHADSESILESINKGNIYRYILKPWEEKDFKLTIRQALDLYNLQSERRNLLQELEKNNRLLTERVAQRTKQLLSMERKAYIGKYASQIVHNLNNPLQAVFAGLDMAIQELSSANPSPVKLDKYMQMAKSSATDMGQIIAGILDHSRDAIQLGTEQVDVNGIIEKELNFFRINPFFRKQIVTQVHLAEKLPTILGNPLQIKQIVDNLIKNAIDAMEESSDKRLTIETSADAGTVSIKISDAGHGIPRAHMKKIFSPDFTTKLPGKGMGLGLASVKAMVEAYSGNISVESEEGRGTTFVIKIPIGKA